MNLKVAKTLIALTVISLSAPTAFAQAPRKATPAATHSDQEKIGLRAAVLQARLGQAVKSQTITQATANALFKELANVRSSVASLARQQGFVSAAEKASYQRTFTNVERALAPNQILAWRAR